VVKPTLVVKAKGVQIGDSNSPHTARKPGALVLTRKLGEKIMVGDDIVIQVTLIAGNKVRLGIRAPDSVPILREEALATEPGKRTRRAPADGSPRDGNGTLVLTRKLGEKIMVGDDIVIQVTLIAGNKVRLGIQAPQSLPIHREEIHHQRLASAARPDTPAYSERPAEPRTDGR
jgi:carbon storage regulator